MQYSHACDVDPRSALSRFKKARALMSLRHPREALAELLILKDMAPDEANVHFMLGRLYKMLRDKTSAIRHFTIALNLDPKVSIKMRLCCSFKCVEVYFFFTCRLRNILRKLWSTWKMTTTTKMMIMRTKKWPKFFFFERCSFG